MSNYLNKLLQPVKTEITHEEALRKIAELNAEIQQKDQIIDAHMKEMQFMKEKMDDCLKSLNHILSQLVTAKDNFKSGQELLLAKISEKDKTISELEQANDAWAERTIKLEFELLTVKNSLH